MQADNGILIATASYDNVNKIIVKGSPALLHTCCAYMLIYVVDVVVTVQIIFIRMFFCAGKQYNTVHRTLTMTFESHRTLIDLLLLCYIYLWGLDILHLVA